jgi:hypothetical protein
LRRRTTLENETVDIQCSELSWNFCIRMVASARQMTASELHPFACLRNRVLWRTEGNSMAELSQRWNFSSVLIYLRFWSSGIWWFWFSQTRIHSMTAGLWIVPIDDQHSQSSIRGGNFLGLEIGSITNWSESDNTDCDGRKKDCRSLSEKVRFLWLFETPSSIFLSIQSEGQMALNESDFRFRAVARTKIIFRPSNRSVELRRHFLANGGFWSSFRREFCDGTNFRTFPEFSLL